MGDLFRTLHLATEGSFVPSVAPRGQQLAIASLYHLVAALLPTPAPVIPVSTKNLNSPGVFRVSEQDRTVPR